VSNTKRRRMQRNKVPQSTTNSDGNSVYKLDDQSADDEHTRDI